MHSDFNIQIDDDSEFLSQYAAEENIKFVKLHDWQKEGLTYFFSNDNKAIFECATGTGKTFFAIQLLKKIWELDCNLRCLIVVPKNVILETGWYKELYQNGINLKDIGIYYGRVKEYAKITITNIQNLKNIATDLFEIVIFDEVHNMGTKNLQQYVKMDFKYKIGLSATLERMDDAHHKITELFDYNVFRYTPEEAIRDDVINAFNFINISVEMDFESQETYDLLTQQINSILQSGGGFNKIMKYGGGLKNKMLKLMTERKKLINNYPRKFEIIKNICSDHISCKILIFNEFNDTTTKCYWHLLDNHISAKILHSGIKQVQRDQTLIDFKNDRFNVLLATRVLDEGYNLPSIDVGVIMAGNSTARQTIQRMGRVLRKKTNNSVLYQIYCLGTVEHQYAMERSKLFKELCSKYDEFIYKINGEVTHI